MKISYDFFANVAQCFQCALLEIVVLHHHVIHECFDQIRPLIAGQFDKGYLRKHLPKMKMEGGCIKREPSLQRAPPRPSFVIHVPEQRYDEQP